MTTIDAFADLKAWRSATRKRLVAERMALCEGERTHCDARITRHLGSLLASVDGGVLGFCWPYQGEFDSRPLVKALLARGLRAALPVVIAPRTPLIFREWHLAAAMENDAYGIPVPAATMPVVAPDLVLLPMNGFDAAGYRLGYGGGFFDRTLAAMRQHPIVIGISYELGRLQTIHPQPHDIPLDFVVTESGAFRRTDTGLRPVP